MIYFERVVQLGRWRFGITHDLVEEGNAPYLERWILWFGATLRLHKFHKGDDDRAFHDHPWWFVTLPLRAYQEATPDGNVEVLRAFRPRFRSAKHRHIVSLIENRPVWTFIVTGPKSQEWGFWDAERFTHHSQWLEQNRAA